MEQIILKSECDSTLEANPDKIYWDLLSINPYAIHLLEANPDKIDWKMLSVNLNAIHILEANPKKIDWGHLSSNCNAIHILEGNLDKINRNWLLWNPFALAPARVESSFYLKRTLVSRLYEGRALEWILYWLYKIIMRFIS